MVPGSVDDASVGEVGSPPERHHSRDIQAIIDQQVANLYHSPAGDAAEEPRLLDSPHKGANEVELVIGQPAATDIWEEAYPENAATPTYVLLYRKGDMVPSVWNLPPEGSFKFQPDLSKQPY